MRSNLEAMGIACPNGTGIPHWYHEGRDTRVSQTRSERQTRSFVVFRTKLLVCRSLRVWETLVSRPSWYHNASELKKVFHPPEIPHWSSSSICTKKTVDQLAWEVTRRHSRRHFQKATATSRSWFSKPRPPKYKWPSLSVGPSPKLLLHAATNGKQANDILNRQRILFRRDFYLLASLKCGRLGETKGGLRAPRRTIELPWQPKDDCGKRLKQQQMECLWKFFYVFFVVHDWMHEHWSPEDMTW